MNEKWIIRREGHTLKINYFVAISDNDCECNMNREGVLFYGREEIFKVV